MPYTHLHYPKVKYHKTLTLITVANAEHEARLSDEWADTPAAFQQDKEPTSRGEGLAQAEAHVYAQDGVMDACAAEEVVTAAGDKLRAGATKQARRKK